MKYRTLKEKNIINGTTTISFGEMRADETDKLAVKIAGNALEDIIWDKYNDYFETKGVSKLAEGDTYNKSTGLKVASIKAEVKAREKAARKYSRAIKALEETVGILKRRSAINEDRLSILNKEKEKTHK